MLKKKKYNEGSIKRKLRSEADALWHIAVKIKWGDRCIIDYCGVQVKWCHHYKPKGQYGFLRYDLDNGVPICWPHHYRLEKADNSLVGQIVIKRGKEWYEKMEKKVKEKPVSSFKTIGYYRDKIEYLKNYIKKNKERSMIR